VALAAPTATLLSDTLSGGMRTLRVQVASPRHAAYATVLVEAQGEIVAASLDGHPFDLMPSASIVEYATVACS
jgi:hypothetical protein